MLYVLPVDISASLTFKGLMTTTADDTLKYLNAHFKLVIENKTCHFI